MDTLPTNVFHYILYWLLPAERILVAAVSKDWYVKARANGAWHLDMQRLVNFCPELQLIFDAYPARADNTYTKVALAKSSAKRRKTVWKPNQGYWYVFQRFFVDIAKAFQKWCSSDVLRWRTYVRLDQVQIGLAYLTFIYKTLYMDKHVIRVKLSKNDFYVSFECIASFGAHFEIEGRFSRILDTFYLSYGNANPNPIRRILIDSTLYSQHVRALRISHDMAKKHYHPPILSNAQLIANGFAMQQENMFRLNVEWLTNYCQRKVNKGYTFL